MRLTYCIRRWWALKRHKARWDSAEPVAFPRAVTEHAAEMQERGYDPLPSSRPGPLTTLMPIRAGSTRLVLVRLKLGLIVPWLELKRLGRLGFLHTGRWQVVQSFPFSGPPQSPERSRTTYLLFASDYDGQFDTYIDAFSDVLAFRLNTLWHWCEEYPGAAPSGPVKEWLRRWKLGEEHYYSAYPNAPAKAIDQALALARAWQRFDSAWGKAPAAEFQSAFRRFVKDNQALL